MNLKPIFLLILNCVIFSLSISAADNDISIVKRGDIQIRDPFILVDKGAYYLYGTTDKDPWAGGGGFDVYRSHDLENFEGPITAFRPDKDFWGTRCYWAPECVAYKGNYYMFATITDAKGMRGTTILKSSTPEGPFNPYIEGKITPSDWMALDGTLYIDSKEQPWMVFCHEWVQIGDGAMCAMRLSEDLKTTIGNPITLFKASEASWTTFFTNNDVKEARVTDGPFIYKNSKNELIMIWSSMGKDGYTMGMARSASGDILGDWEQLDTPLFKKDGGHGMIFKNLDGKLMVSLHHPNNTPNERPLFIEIEEDPDGVLKLKN